MEDGVDVFLLLFVGQALMQAVRQSPHFRIDLAFGILRGACLFLRGQFLINPRGRGSDGVPFRVVKLAVPQLQNITVEKGGPGEGRFRSG